MPCSAAPRSNGARRQRRLSQRPMLHRQSGSCHNDGPTTEAVRRATAVWSRCLKVLQLSERFFDPTRRRTV